MRICSGAGCLRVVPNDVRYCDECKPTPIIVEDTVAEHTTGYTAQLDALRKSRRWQALRLMVIRKQPMCAMCNRAVSDICDHIVPAEFAVMQAQLSGKYLDRWAGYFLRSNLQGLCRPCHYIKTCADKLHRGPWPDVVATEALAPKKKWSFG